MDYAHRERGRDVRVPIFGSGLSGLEAPFILENPIVHEKHEHIQIDAAINSYTYRVTRYTMVTN